MNLASKIIYLSVVLIFSAPVFAAQGGISDGGGSTTISGPTNAELIYRAATETAPKMIWTWLKGEQANFQSRSEYPEDVAIFFSKPASDKKILDVFELLKKIKLRIQKEPCSHNGEHKEASVSAEDGNVICLSTSEMGKRLTESNYVEETIALIVHELAHLMGGDEKVAQDAQEDALYSLRAANISNIDLMIRMLMPRPRIGSAGYIVEAAESIERVSSWKKSFSPLDIEKAISILTRIRGQMNLDSYVYSFRLDENQEFIFWAMLTQLRSIQDELLAADDREERELRQWYLENIEKSFAGKDTVSFREYDLNSKNFVSDNPLIDTTFLARTRGDSSKIKLEFEKIIERLVQFSERALELSRFQFRTVDDNQPNWIDVWKDFVELESEKNDASAFREFVGTYEVITKQSGDRPVQKIQLTEEFGAGFRVYEIWGKHSSIGRPVWGGEDMQGSNGVKAYRRYGKIKNSEGAAWIAKEIGFQGELSRREEVIAIERKGDKYFYVYSLRSRYSSGNTNSYQLSLELKKVSMPK